MSFPKEGKERTIRVQDYMDNQNIGWCVEAHDLAASKLIAFREKDTEFVRTLLIQRMIKPDTLMNRLEAIEEKQKRKERAMDWVQMVYNKL